MNELLPCPFCGGEAICYDIAGVEKVICEKCGARISDEGQEWTGKRAWNKRAERIEVYPDGESGISINGITYVPVVRCRDCTVYDGEGYGCSYGRGNDPDGFCAWGESAWVTCKCGEDIEKLGRIQICPSCGRVVFA